MPGSIRVFLAAQTLVFFVAALIHFEVLFEGYDDRSAGIAESVIGGVLLIGLFITYLRPAWTRTVALAVQVFALLGTFVGLTLLLSVGPSTILDLVIHLVMVVLLLAGIVTTVRSRRVSP